MGNILPRALHKNTLHDSEGIVAHLYCIYQPRPLSGESICDIMRAEESMEFNNNGSNHF
jgi:hypothetical protein